MRVALAIILLFLILAALLRSTRRPALFVIEIEEGRPRAKKGKVSHRFLQDCEEVCRSVGIKKGTIQAVKDLEGVRLIFSRDIPEAYHQRFRNIWRIHGNDGMA